MEWWSKGVYQIPKSKHQITNKSQIPILNDQNRFGFLNFGHCDLFDICDLLFGIFVAPVLYLACFGILNHVT